MSDSPVSDVVSVVPVNMLTDTSWFAPLSPPVFTGVSGGCRPGWWSRRSSTLLLCLQICRLLQADSHHSIRVSLASTDSVDRVVVESPVSDAVLVVELDMFPNSSQFALLTHQGLQVSHLCHQCDCRLIGCVWTSIWILLMCSLCLRRLRDPAGFYRLSHLPSSHTSPAAGSLLDEADASRDSVIGSPATSLSIADHTADLHLRTPPLIPLPDTVLLQADPALLIELTETYHDFRDNHDNLSVHWKVTYSLRQRLQKKGTVSETDYMKCIICQNEGVKDLCRVQPDTQKNTIDHVAVGLEHDVKCHVWLTNEPKWHHKCRNVYINEKSYMLAKRKRANTSIDASSSADIPSCSSKPTRTIVGHK